MKSRLRLRHLIVIGTIALLLTVIACADIILSQRSLALIRIGSMPVNSRVTDQQLEQQLALSIRNYRLVLKYPDGSTKAYTLKDIGVSIDISTSVKHVRNGIKHASFRRLVWWRPMEFQLATKVDPLSFTHFIETDGTRTTNPAKDASVSIEDGAVKIVPEATGKGYTVPDSGVPIQDLVSKLQRGPVTLKQSTLYPAVKAEKLASVQDKVKRIIGQPVVFTIDSSSVRATSGDIAGWLDLSPVNSANTVDVTVNSGKVLDYINAISASYIQPPRSRLITKVADGYVVLDPGKNGVDIVNKDQAASDLAKKVLGAKGATINLSAQYSTAKTIEAPQPYDKWFVVDVATKRMYAYEQTNLVKTFLISSGAPGTPTVLGQYAIYAKYRSQDMRGDNADGSRYFQPDVPYINYFYKDFAIHGNYWRPASYFGNINSSHGCVGIIPSDAEWVYDWAPVGTPVIVHD